MENFVGQKLDIVINELKKQEKSYKLVCNNHNVEGDTKLVTNVEMGEDNVIILTYGEFIFNLKD